MSDSDQELSTIQLEWERKKTNLDKKTIDTIQKLAKEYGFTESEVFNLYERNYSNLNVVEEQIKMLVEKNQQDDDEGWIDSKPQTNSNNITNSKSKDLNRQPKNTKKPYQKQQNQDSNNYQDKPQSRQYKNNDYQDKYESKNYDRQYQNNDRQYQNNDRRQYEQKQNRQYNNNYDRDNKYKKQDDYQYKPRNYINNKYRNQSDQEFVQHPTYVIKETSQIDQQEQQNQQQQQPSQQDQQQQQHSDQKQQQQQQQQEQHSDQKKQQNPQQHQHQHQHHAPQQAKEQPNLHEKVKVHETHTIPAQKTVDHQPSDKHHSAVHQVAPQQAAANLQSIQPPQQVKNQQSPKPAAVIQPRSPPKINQTKPTPTPPVGQTTVLHQPNQTNQANHPQQQGTPLNYIHAPLSYAQHPHQSYVPQPQIYGQTFAQTPSKPAGPLLVQFLIYPNNQTSQPQIFPLNLNNLQQAYSQLMQVVQSYAQGQ